MRSLEDPFDRYRRQFQRIQRELRIPGEVGEEIIELECRDLNRPTGAYQRDHVIAHTEADASFLETEVTAARVGPARSGTTLMRVSEDAYELVQRLRVARGAAAYSLNHLIAVAVGDVNLCPCDEPIPAGEGARMYPDPSAADPRAGGGVTVDVLDTGAIHTYAEHGHLSDIEVLGFRKPLRDGDFVPLDYGHGTFVAGVLRSVAPAAHVRVSALLRRAGATTETALHAALEEAIARKPDIISLSAGNTSTDVRTMQSLKPVVQKVRDAGIVLVAAAGNNGNDIPFFPAAFDGVVSVGAARRGARGRACFSNFGEWVDLYAPGERLVNAFVTEGTYQTRHEGRDTCHFRRRGQEGWYGNCTCVDTLDQGQESTYPRFLARWSGTSFATPIVSALIAARLAKAREADDGYTAQQAATWLQRHPAEVVQGMGPLVRPAQSLVSPCGTDPDCEGGCAA